MIELPPPEDDGLFIPTVGEWSRDKHHFLRRYLDAFTTAMRNKKWDGLHYVDLFAGAGLARLKTSRKLEWGSPVIAARAPFSFSCLHLCEKDREAFAALEKRLGRIRPQQQIRLFHGDANQKIREIVSGIPQGTLSVAFLDPFGLHLEFNCLVQLANRRADLIVFFPDRSDILRNWLKYYFDNPESNLDRYLGAGVNWRAMIETVPHHRLCDRFLKLYQGQIEKLGYRYFDYERISTDRGPLYRLIYASRNQVGLRIWRRVAQRKPDRQDTFDFGES